jgi:hypothetical protein
MITNRSHRIAAGLVASCLAGGLGAVALNGSAAARTGGPAVTIRNAVVHAEVPGSPTSGAGTSDAGAPAPGIPEGVASTSSPYIAGVPHVPADVLLVMGPDGSDEGARFVGPDGSLFNGPVDEVEALLAAP